MELKEVNNTIFESIKHFDEEGMEYWLARELMIVLEYKQWRRFNETINKAMIACKNSNRNIHDHFADIGKMVEIGSSTKRKIQDYKLSRYACYLIVQEADSRKEVVALGKTYFAIQTRRQELLDKDYELMSENKKRLYQRDLIKKGNRSLNITVKNAGVKNFDKFHNAGYKGLYNGETADDIAKRKELRYREDILDNMGSEELVDNWFRIIHTEAKIKRDSIVGENESCDIHYKMGKDIRNFIKKQGGTMPEDIPTPKKSLKELDKYNDIETQRR